MSIRVQLPQMEYVHMCTRTQTYSAIVNGMQSENRRCVSPSPFCKFSKLFDIKGEYILEFWGARCGDMGWGWMKGALGGAAGWGG